MEYPKIEINLSKIRHNTKIITDMCKDIGINVVGVAKVSNGSLEIAQAMLDGGATAIGDSRLKNMEQYKDIKGKKMLIRIPMMSEVPQLVKIADISLNSEIEVIKAISKEAEKVNKVHQIILMVDVGDLREGIFNEDEIMETVEEILKLKGVDLIGIGTNLTCYGGIIPSKENLGNLVHLRDKINKKFNIQLDIISGGNSSSMALIQKGEMPKGINQLRLGACILLGLVEVTWTRIPNTYIDAFKLVAEIVEIKEKPSKPIGEIAMDAFRNVPTFEDKGIMKRAICAVGRVDTDFDFMIPEDERIKILGGSSDHLILDITDCGCDYHIGDKVSFVLDYVAILRCMISSHVTKVYVD